MRDLCLGRRLIFPACLALVAGCQAFHQYRPVTVLARDAETKKPIPGADVRISYPLTQPSLAPWDSNGPTGEDGVARLRAAPYGDAGIRIAVTANGYMSDETSLPVSAVEAIKPAGFFEAADRRSAEVVLELYADPHPTVDLVVPPGYRGLVKADVQTLDNAPVVPGQRSFSYIVPTTGLVHVTGPALLKRVYAADFRLRYADGAPLTPQAKDSEVGFWWLKYEETLQVFLVGHTVSEYNTYPPHQ